MRHPVGSKPLPPSSSGAASSSSVVAASISQATGSDPSQHAITASNQVQQHLQVDTHTHTSSSCMQWGACAWLA